MKIIDLEDKEYPEKLKRIKKPPKKLYYEGNIELLSTLGIAIIGTRKPTEYGERITKKFAEELSLYNLTIISGMAEGVDALAHIGSIETKGKTIAVLPCGLKNIFPKQNINLFNSIIENGGLVISEYEENEEADYNRFLERNRIVAGLGIGTLVIEGGHRSGTGVTARLTKEQNKNVFCIPSSIENPRGITPNRLIKEGAFLVTEVKDIINKYPELELKKRRRPRKVGPKEIRKIKLESISEEYREIYNTLDFETPTHINEIAKKTKADMQEINYKLMMLEIEDKIISLPGNYYKIK